MAARKVAKTTKKIHPEALGEEVLSGQEIADFQAAGFVPVDDRLTPLEYMLKVMRDPAATTARKDSMAIACAPFMHPKLSAIAVQGPNNGPIHVATVSYAPTDPNAMPLPPPLPPAIGTADDLI
jgi:hypothetical protein